MEDTIVGAKSQKDLRDFKAQLHHRLIMSMDLTALSGMSKDHLHEEVRRVADELCQRSSNLLSRTERRAARK